MAEANMLPPRSRGCRHDECRCMRFREKDEGATDECGVCAHVEAEHAPCSRKQYQFTRDQVDGSNRCLSCGLDVVAHVAAEHGPCSRKQYQFTRDHVDSSNRCLSCGLDVVAHVEAEHASCSLTQEQLFQAPPHLVPNGRCSACGLDVGRHRSVEAASGVSSTSMSVLIDAVARLEVAQRESQRETQLEVHRLREEFPSVVVVGVITPSGASDSQSPEKRAFETLLTKLSLSIPDVGDDSPVATSGTAAGSWQWRWNDRVERDGYDPLADHVNKLFSDSKLNAVVIDNDQRMRGGLLFDEAIYALRSHEGAHGENLLVRGRIKGRSDLAVLDPNHDVAMYGVPRYAVRFVIEVKMSADDTKTGVNEAVAQLIGLNADNDRRSPPVLLTNLMGTHRVYWIHRVSASPLQFAIRMRRFKSLNDALFHCKLLSERACVTVHFCRCPTPRVSPEVSPAGSGESSPSGTVVEVGSQL